MTHEENWRFVPALERNAGKFGWIEIFSLFSFNNYFDPENTHFGNITVLNEYTIPTSFGFPMHPHENIDLVFLVLDGTLSFRDQGGQAALAPPGSVVALSCGSGYAHMIHNYDEAPLRLLAIWMVPAEKGTVPFFNIKRFSPAHYADRLLPLAAREGRSGVCDALPVKAASVVYRTALEEKSVSYEMPSGSTGLVYVLEGRGSLNGTPLAAGDHVRISKPTRLEFIPQGFFDCIFIEMG